MISLVDQRPPNPATAAPPVIVLILMVDLDVVVYCNPA